jgi:hypothetical protein
MRSTFALGLGTALLVSVFSGCASTRSEPREPMSFPLNCRADENAADCLRTVSEMCGERGYDLFDAAGAPITLAELKFGKATARCRPLHGGD